MTRGIDVSVLLTLHREGKYLARTLASLSEMAAFARAQGISSELLVIQYRLDRATRGILRDADLSAFERVHSIDVEKSLGPSRNDGCDAASGRYITTADGDDLASYTFIARMYAAAEKLGPGVVLAPKFNFAFGASYFTVEYFSQDEISTAAIVKYPLFTSRLFAHRSVFERVRYADVPLSSGYASEDWHFDCEAMAAGYRYVAVAGTALFYRQRSDSFLHESDRISTQEIPPSNLFRPPVFLRLFADEIHQLERLRSQFGALTLRGVNVFEEPVYRDIVARANAIDPAIDIGRYSWNCLGHYSNFADPAPGVAYYRLCEIVGDKTFDDVFLLPGGAPPGGLDPVLNAMRELALQNPDARILALADEGFAAEHGDSRMPPSVLRLDLAHLCDDLATEGRDLLCLKLLQSCAPGAALHCSPSPFAWRFFTRFGALLRDYYVVCYRDADRTTGADDYPFVDPHNFEFVAEYLDSIDRVIAFDKETIDADRRRLGDLQDKWRLHDRRAPRNATEQ